MDHGECAHAKKKARLMRGNIKKASKYKDKVKTPDFWSGEAALPKNIKRRNI